MKDEWDMQHKWKDMIAKSCSENFKESDHTGKSQTDKTVLEQTLQKLGMMAQTGFY